MRYLFLLIFNFHIPFAYCNQSFLDDANSESLIKTRNALEVQIRNNDLEPLRPRVGERTRVRLEYPNTQTLIPQVREFNYFNFGRDARNTINYTYGLRNIFSQGTSASEIAAPTRTIMRNHSQLMLEGNARVQILLNLLEEMDTKELNAITDPMTKKPISATDAAKELTNIKTFLLDLERNFSDVKKLQPDLFKKIGLPEPSTFASKIHPVLVDAGAKGSVVKKRIARAFAGEFVSSEKGAARKGLTRFFKALR